jgi:hypothetical protein
MVRLLIHLAQFLAKENAEFIGRNRVRKLSELNSKTTI